MNFIGSVRKDGAQWLAEAPALDAMTQGQTRQEAIEMLEDWIKTLVNERGFSVRIDVLATNQLAIQTSATPKIFGLMLQRQRQKSGLSQADAAKLLGFASVNAYAAYEQGRREPSLSKADELLDAVSKIDRIRLAAG